MRILDSNVLIADSNAADPLHAQATQLDFSQGILADIAFIEFVNVLERRLRQKDKIALLANHVRAQFILQETGFKLTAEAMDLFLRYFGKISFTDATLLALATKQNYTLVTLDEKLQEAARAEGIRVEPT